MIVSQLWQYPVKGLAGMTLDSIRLEAGKHFPGDRRFAVANGHPKQDEALAGRWVKKSFFLQMMTYEELAGFDCRFAGTRLTLLRDGVTLLDADLEEDSGIEAVNSWFARQFEGRLGGAPRLARVADGAFTDTKAPWISLGGTASVATFLESDIEVDEYVIEDGAPAVGMRVADLHLPHSVVLGAVIRPGEEGRIVRGSTVLSAGDNVVVFSRPESVPDLLKAFSA